ncbi:MAG: hypothetical protein L3J74_03070 [Bacteroidales bacterium]|nr:hypothetical protein [Bacteroidales bacterium]
MKPFNILIFMLSVLFGMLILSLLIPKDGLKISENWTLHFPSLEETFMPQEDKYVDITEIIAKNQVPDTLDRNEDKQLEKAFLKDSSIVYYQPIDIKPGQVRQKIEYGKNGKTALYPFFKQLASLTESGKLIRILHYGDSQIEADRMTSYLRYKLQSQFGGNGPGLIPAVQPYNFRSPAVIESEGSWKRYPGYGKRDSTVWHKRYGVLASFSRFSPIKYPEPVIIETKNKDTIQLSVHNKDTIQKTDIEQEERQIYKAALTISPSPYSVKRVRRYTQARLFYGYNEKPFDLKLYTGETLFSENTLISSNKLQVKRWLFPNPPKYIRLEFSGEDSPDIFALALDGTRGIAVDNIPLRGSGGIVFTNSDQNLLANIYGKLNVKLVILQFGGNVAPGMRDNYKFYERSFYRQIKAIQRLIPDVSIIVIGLGDMSMKEKDTYVSYPNIKLIRDALKNASFKAGCAFWDMYEAMGGENSMPSWVFSEPALAEKDFIHFTVRGSKIIAKMFYRALMLDYENFIKKQNSLPINNDEGKVQLSSNK